jgi:hypothetical protein
MKARMQVALIKLSDPRAVRVVMIGLVLAMALLGTGTAAALSPGGASGGCSGG